MIIKFEGEPPFDTKREFHKRTMSWKRGVQKGFIIQKREPEKTYVVEVRGPTDMNLEYEKAYDVFYPELAISSFFGKEPAPKISDQRPFVCVDSPLIAFYPEGGSSSAYLGQLFFDPSEESEFGDDDSDQATQPASKKDASEANHFANLMRIDFDGVIVACGKYPLRLPFALGGWMEKDEAEAEIHEI